jgi:hypothetical protein
MKIHDYHNERDASTPAEIEAMLGERHGMGRNAFWLFHGCNEFPWLSVMVIGDLAYAHYFPHERHPGFASVGMLPGLKSGENTVFFFPSSKEPLPIMNEAVVRFSDALRAAQEFAISPELPKCVQWSEL